MYAKHRTKEASGRVWPSLCHSPLSEEASTDPVEDDAQTSEASATACCVVDDADGVLKDGERREEVGAGCVVSEGGGDVEEPWHVGGCSCG